MCYRKKNALLYFVDLCCSRSLQAAVKLLALGSLCIRAEYWWRHVALKWGLSHSPPLWLTAIIANTHLLHLRVTKEAAPEMTSLHLNVYFPHTECAWGGRKKIKEQMCQIYFYYRCVHLLAHFWCSEHVSRKLLMKMAVFNQSKTHIVRRWYGELETEMEIRWGGWQADWIERKRERGIEASGLADSVSSSRQVEVGPICGCLSVWVYRCFHSGRGY